MYTHLGHFTKLKRCDRFQRNLSYKFSLQKFPDTSNYLVKNIGQWILWQHGHWSLRLFSHRPLTLCEFKKIYISPAFCGCVDPIPLHKLIKKKSKLFMQFAVECPRKHHLWWNNFYHPFSCSIFCHKLFQEQCFVEGCGFLRCVQCPKSLNLSYQN